MKAFATSQCILSIYWMFHTRGFNDKINSLQERVLRVTSEISSSSEDLFKNSVSIHHRNIQVLATETFKGKNNVAPEITREILAPKISPCDSQNNKSFQTRGVNSV